MIKGLLSKRTQLSVCFRAVFQVSVRNIQSSAIFCDKLYSKKHEWVELQDGDTSARVGMTQYAVEALGKDSKHTGWFNNSEYRTGN